MNNRPTTFSNNEWIHQKTNPSYDQCSQNIVSTHDMRPPYRLPENFNRELIAKSNKPDATTFNSSFHERAENLTYCAPADFKSEQGEISSTRLTHQNPPSNQFNSNFQDSHRNRYDSPRTNFNAPNSDRFSKIPCNLASVQSSDRNYSEQRHPPFNQFEMTPNLNNFTQRPPPPVSNMPQFLARTFQANTNASRPPIRAPPTSTASGFIRSPSLSLNKPNLEQPTLSSSVNPSFSRQTTPLSSVNSNFARQLAPSGSGNPNFGRKPAPMGSENSNFVRQPPPFDFNRPDFFRQPPPLNPVMQLPPQSAVMQPPPQSAIMQPPPQSAVMLPPPVLPPSNVYGSSGNSGPLQTPPPILTFAVPTFTTLNQNSNCNTVLPNVSMPPPPINQDLLEENKINNFLQRFAQNDKSSTKCDLTMSEFRSKLKEAYTAAKKLMVLKSDLLNLLDANENEWNEKLKEISFYKDKLTKECDLLSEPKVLNLIQERLESRKRKRELKKKIRANKREEKAKKLKIREELHQTTDKWLESIKEKNSKLKREVEMKKEADFILAEVRRKIHEAKRTIEKLKIFEKLRSARHANAAKKGLFLPEHDEKFKVKISELKATLFKQLSDYESEEKALKVMLEAEQEGQLEEEALWRIKKLKTAQQRRQKNITESLFGTEEEPTEDDPIFLFHQFQNSGNKSIESLVQIRHQWDVHLNADGETVSSQWVVPVPPSSAAWEGTLNS